MTTSPGRRARRGFHARFMVLSAIVVTGLVAGVGSLSAMLVEVSFRVEELRARIAESTQRAESLTSDVAELSSPFRIAAWAEGHGMVTPDDVVALTVEAGSGG